MQSLAFTDHSLIPARYTAGGGGGSPPLNRSGIPTSATSMPSVVGDTLDDFAEPAESTICSEISIVSALIQATLDPNPRLRLQEWVGDIRMVRSAIEATWPEIFGDFNGRLRAPDRIQKPIATRERVWKTPSDKANFIVPDSLSASADTPERGPDGMRLMTMPSDNQLSTTISLDDRFRGIYGTRRVLLVAVFDIERLGLVDGFFVAPPTAVDVGILREVSGLRVTAFDIPRGCIAGYSPWCNPLMPLAHHAGCRHH